MSDGKSFHEVSAGVAWFPIPYIGIRVDMGCVGEIKELADWGTEYPDHAYCLRFKCTPSVELRTPNLVYWPARRATICLFTNPGMSLSPGGAGSHHADWYNWTVRSGLMLKSESIRIAIGYGISDYYLLSGNPYSHQQMYKPQSHPLTHQAFVTVSFTL